MKGTTLCTEAFGELSVYSYTPGSLGIQGAYYVHKLPRHSFVERRVEQNGPVNRVTCALEIQKHQNCGSFIPMALFLHPPKFDDLLSATPTKPESRSLLLSQCLSSHHKATKHYQCQQSRYDRGQACDCHNLYVLHFRKLPLSSTVPSCLGQIPCDGLCGMSLFLYVQFMVVRCVPQATVRAVLLCGCKTWPLRTNDVRRTHVFDHRCPRSVTGVGWRQRVSNDVIRKRVFGYAVIHSGNTSSTTNYDGWAMCYACRNTVYRDGSFSPCLVQNGSNCEEANKSVKEIRRSLGGVGVIHLPGWGPHDPTCGLQETLREMVANHYQWRSCCQVLSRLLIERLEFKLNCDGHCRLSGWGPRNGPHQWLETLSDMAQSRPQWRLCIQAIAFNA
ncbi:LOW QUALITY PROTEIN: hypothetical protein T265_12654 [Opisthorchis viverrini]|uniref:Uncharacterized protein n=1 Tax=Opisthorchis viverrini TaxID=6198 RepID=A0A075A4J2_OPIVI|nr:LOW QUALITY PROTEIN: hypothetical protein T265_12654 [Opisthorchis viverrini]KER33167.1 LOW QUALITY PROTEIN: hypothetical protein T265_12654 [Opisthorchis viverrini]